MLMDLPLEYCRLELVINKSVGRSPKNCHEGTERHAFCLLIEQSAFANEFTTTVANADENVPDPGHDSIGHLHINEYVIIKT